MKRALLFLLLLAASLVGCVVAEHGDDDQWANSTCQRRGGVLEFEGYDSWSGDSATVVCEDGSAFQR